MVSAGKGKVFQWGFFPSEEHVEGETGRQNRCGKISAAELNSQPTAVDSSCTTETDQEQERFRECGPHPGNLSAVEPQFGPHVIVTAVAAGDGHCLALTGGLLLPPLLSFRSKEAWSS